MRINVKLFAILRERAGIPEVALDLPGGATVGDASDHLAGMFPELRAFLPRIAFAVNEAYVQRDHVLGDGDELALIPPVSGGRA